MIRIAVSIPLLGLLACGARWTDADANATSYSARAQLRVEAICAADGGCVASQVRALERMAFCQSSATLYRHGVTAPDSGIACQP